MRFSPLHFLLLGAAFAAPIKDVQHTSKRSVQTVQVARGLVLLDSRSPKVFQGPKVVTQKAPPPAARPRPKSKGDKDDVSATPPPLIENGTPAKGDGLPPSGQPKDGDGKAQPKDADGPAPAKCKRADNCEVGPSSEKKKTVEEIRDDGRRVHNDLHAAIRDNKDDEPWANYKDKKDANGNPMYERETPRTTKDFVSEDSEDLWKEQGFAVDRKRWKTAVMDRPDHFERSDGSSDGGSSHGGSSASTDDINAAQVENFHDVKSGMIISKVQTGDDRDNKLPFSEQSFQMAKEDFGDIKKLNKIGVELIVNEDWNKIAIGLGVRDQWKTFNRGDDGFDELLGTDNGKWVARMLKDHHNEMGNKDIESISAVRVGDAGRMVLNLAPFSG